MKKLTLLILLSAIQLSSFATDFQGVISANTTWTKANSPYHITGQIQINSGVQLTIEPGVEVIVDGDYEIYVEGSVSAIGTDADPIIIRPQSTDITEPLWKGFILRKTTSTPTATFHYSNISGAETPVMGYQDNVIVDIQHCTLSYINTCGYIIGKLTFNNNKLLVFESGIGVMAVEASEIKNNVISGIDTKPVHFSSGWGIGYKAKDNASVVVSGNTVTNVNTGFNVINCKTCVCENNISMKNDVGFKSNEYSPDVSVPISNNIIAYNNVGIQISNHWAAYSNNTIKHNQWGIRLANSPEEILIEHNCIDSNTEFSFVNGLGYGNDFAVGPNYWGSTDSAYIRSTMSDYYKDFAKGAVIYTPFLTQPDSSCQLVSAPLGIKETQYQFPMSISIYPNPFTATFTIHTDGSTPINEVSVYNMVGSNIRTIKTKDTKVDIDLGSYPAGMYIYTIRFADNRVYTGKIQKQ